MATFAPVSAIAFAVACPRPEAPPVTIAEIEIEFHKRLLQEAL
nr:hypothetical protein [Sphingomonas sp. J344]